MEPFPEMPFRRAEGDPTEMGQLLAAVSARYPTLRVTEIHLPARRVSPQVVYLKAPGDVHRLGDTVALFHPVGGDLLVERSRRTRSAGEELLHWLFALHSGTALGTPGRIATAVLGLVPLALFLTGLLIWLAKRRSARVESRRASANGRKSTPLLRRN